MAGPGDMDTWHHQDGSHSTRLPQVKAPSSRKSPGSPQQNSTGWSHAPPLQDRTVGCVAWGLLRLCNKLERQPNGHIDLAPTAQAVLQLEAMRSQGRPGTRTWGWAALGGGGGRMRRGWAGAAPRTWAAEEADLSAPVCTQTLRSLQVSVPPLGRLRVKCKGTSS